MGMDARSGRLPEKCRWESSPVRGSMRRTFRKQGTCDQHHPAELQGPTRGPARPHGWARTVSLHVCMQNQKCVLFRVQVSSACSTAHVLTVCCQFCCCPGNKAADLLLYSTTSIRHFFAFLPSGAIVEREICIFLGKTVLENKEVADFI